MASSRLLKTASVGFRADGEQQKHDPSTPTPDLSPLWLFLQRCTAHQRCPRPRLPPSRMQDRDRQQAGYRSQTPPCPPSPPPCGLDPPLGQILDQGHGSLARAARKKSLNGPALRGQGRSRRCANELFRPLGTTDRMEIAERGQDGVGYLQWTCVSRATITTLAALELLSAGASPTAIFQAASCKMESMSSSSPRTWEIQSSFSQPLSRRPLAIEVIAQP